MKIYTHDRIATIIAEYDLLSLGKPDCNQDFDKLTPRQELMQKIRNRLKCELTFREVYGYFREDESIYYIIDFALDERERLKREEWLAVHAPPYIVTDEERREHTTARSWLYSELKYLYQIALTSFGAAAVLRMQGATMLASGDTWPDEGETILNLHLNDLINQIPQEYSKQLDLVSRYDKIMAGLVITKHAQELLDKEKQSKHDRAMSELSAKLKSQK